MPRRSLSCSPGALAALLGTLLVAAPPGMAQNVKLNGPLAPQTRVGSVSDYVFTQAGARVVYRADREEDLRFELFSRPLAGSAPSLKLNGTMQANGDVGVNGSAWPSFAIGAGDRVVYVADESVDEVQELFSVPADGGASRVRISQAGHDVHLYEPFQLNAAGTHAFYVAAPSLSFELFSVPIDGSTAPIALTPGRNVDRFWLGPDGTRVVFSSTTGFGSEALYVVPSDGSAAPLLLTQTHPPPHAWVVVSFEDVECTANGRVFYNEVEDDDAELTYSLYAVRLDASQPEVLIAADHQGSYVLHDDVLEPRVVFYLGGALHSAASDGALGVTLSPVGWYPQLLSAGLLAQVVGSDVLFAAAAYPSWTIYRAAIDGSQPAAALFAPEARTIESFALASPTTLALIRSVGLSQQLEVVPLAGGTPLPLHPVPPNFQGPIAIQPHPGGQKVLFRGDNDTRDVYELYAAPLDASSAPVRLNGPLLANENAGGAAVTPDPAYVTYLAGTFSPSLFKLFRVPLDASAAPLQLNEPIPVAGTVGDVTGVRVTPDAGRLVYRADQESDEVFDLYALDTSAPGAPLLLTAGLPSALPEFAFSPLNDQVVFQTLDDTYALHAADLVSGTAVQLDSSPQVFPTPFEVSTDGTRAVYRRSLTGSDLELRSVALDGLSPPVVLHAPLAAGRTVSQFQVGATGTVAFLSDLAQDEVFELYAVPITGGSPVLLSRSLVPGGDVTAFRIDPAGARAVYVADARFDDVFELFSVPLDASHGPKRLSGTLVYSGDVTDFAIAPGGKAVVYRADQRADSRFDLFSVPLERPRLGQGNPTLDKRKPPVTCLTRLTLTRSVQAGWVISPDGTQVVYLANADVSSDVELFRAPIDASSAPVQLNGPLVSSGDVFSFAIAPDQSRVVYLADQRINARDELFSVPLAGGAVVRLVTLPIFADARAFQITPDSTDVVFLADSTSDEVIELFRVPAGGGTAAVKVNLALPAGGDVEADFIALDGGAIYRADQEIDDVVELFLGQ